MHALKFCCLLLGARKVPKSRSSFAAIGPFYLVRVAAFCFCLCIQMSLEMLNEL